PPATHSPLFPYTTLFRSKIPIHLHTHDTSSLQAATYLMAAEAGVDVVDGALGAVSGLTSQPNLNAIVEMMRFHPRENALDVSSLDRKSTRLNSSHVKISY